MVKLFGKFKNDNDTGFGASASNQAERLINKDGSYNVSRTGVSFFNKLNTYHDLIALSWFKFNLLVLAVYLFMNLIFTFIYWGIGVEHLGGMIAKNKFEEFMEAFFFSCQTFSTVGYGRINPQGYLTSAVASIESLVGLMSFALVTGLIYGKFARPNIKLLNSENAIIAPYKDGSALMMRLAPHKNTNLTDAEAFVTVGILIDENGVISNKFYNLPLEMSKINSLTLSWTLVHPIDEESPLFNLNQSDYRDTSGEILVFVKTFDDMYSSTVTKRTSYTFDEVVYGAKFSSMYSKNESNTKTVLHLEKLNSFIKVKL